MGSTRAVLIVAALATQVVAAMAEAGSAVVPETIAIPAGRFIIGSDRAEREAAYRLDEAAYGHSATRERKWYEAEPERTTLTLGPFQITRTPITNA